MSKHTKLQINELCFPTCVLLPCLSPQFAFYFLLSYDAKEKEYLRYSSASLLFLAGTKKKKPSRDIWRGNNRENNKNHERLTANYMFSSQFTGTFFGKSRFTLSNVITVLVSREIIRAFSDEQKTPYTLI